MIFYHDNDTVLHNGDARHMDLEDGSVQMVVTSPPYWGLRKYAGVPDLIWGGDAECEHEWQTDTWYVNGGGSTGVAGGAFSEPGPDNAKRIKEGRWRSADTCSLCGAWRGSYGLEPTPDCGRPFATLRDDLTEKERAYVMAELEKWGLLQ